jgi:hypothetical protein
MTFGAQIRSHLRGAKTRFLLSLAEGRRLTHAVSRALRPWPSRLEAREPNVLLARSGRIWRDRPPGSGQAHLKDLKQTEKIKGIDMTTVKVGVRNGKVTCGANGGHVRAPHGTVITWKSRGKDKKFVLEFERLGVESAHAGAKLDHWPFQEAPPPGPTNTFAGTLKRLAGSDSAPVYKYSVKVGKRVLDPIVIVDR